VPLGSVTTVRTPSPLPSHPLVLLRSGYKDGTAVHVLPYGLPTVHPLSPSFSPSPRSSCPSLLLLRSGYKDDTAVRVLNGEDVGTLFHRRLPQVAPPAAPNGLDAAAGARHMAVKARDASRRLQVRGAPNEPWCDARCALCVHLDNPRHDPRCALCVPP